MRKDNLCEMLVAIGMMLIVFGLWQISFTLCAVVTGSIMILVGFISHLFWK